MFSGWGIALTMSVIVVLLVLIVAAARLRSRRGGAQLEQARRIFHQRREWLEAKFLTLASQSGKPRGLEWVNCDFDNEVSFARDRGSGELRALVAVTISFEAIEGGGMEDVEAVGNLRAATAVFHFGGGEWFSNGRALFNLNPEQAIERFQELEVVE